MLIPVLITLSGITRSRTVLHLEVAALRHQLHVLHRSRPRLVRVGMTTVGCGSGCRGSGPNWRTALVIVQPDTVIAWHRHRFRWFWAWKSRQWIGRPTVPGQSFRVYFGQDTRIIRTQIQMPRGKWDRGRIRCGPCTATQLCSATCEPLSFPVREPQRGCSAYCSFLRGRRTRTVKGLIAATESMPSRAWSTSPDR